MHDINCTTHTQSAFRYLLRLHYHTSCSYQVHKNCSYRLFSLQELKQIDSRTAAPAVTIALISEKNKSRKKRKKKRKVCVKLWLKRGKNLELYDTLFAEMRWEEEYSYNILLRMTSETFSADKRLYT